MSITRLNPKPVFAMGTASAYTSGTVAAGSWGDVSVTSPAKDGYSLIGIAGITIGSPSRWKLLGYEMNGTIPGSSVCRVRIRNDSSSAEQLSATVLFLFMRL